RELIVVQQEGNEFIQRTQCVCKRSVQPVLIKPDHQDVPEAGDLIRDRPRQLVPIQHQQLQAVQRADRSGNGSLERVVAQVDDPRLRQGADGGRNGSGQRVRRQLQVNDRATFPEFLRYGAGKAIVVKRDRLQLSGVPDGRGNRPFQLVVVQRE